MGADIGVVGLAVMGENLILNMASRGYTVAAFNRTPERVSRFLDGRARGASIVGATDVAGFVALLDRPRAVLLMIKAGDAVDAMIDTLLPHLEPGDVIIDGGNSQFGDTTRRVRGLAERGISFIGSGVSGGEEGALHGPSIMPGGNIDGWARVRPILQAIAARAPDGAACCEWLGPDGAGHFVKMVHNGIEYGDMQMIAEAYGLLRDVAGMTNGEIGETFAAWNEGELDSFLIEITADILRTPDDQGGGDLVDVILDAAGQKGTGKWTSVTALDVGSPASTIAEAVFARCLSAQTRERALASAVYAAPMPVPLDDRAAFVEAVRRGLFASKICSYAQGFQLLRLAAAEHGWTLDLRAIALIWRAGCIIRARFLDDIAAAYVAEPELPNLLLDPAFADRMNDLTPAWREVVATAARAGAWVPAFSSALAYFDGIRRDRLPTNLVQAQRDYFGAHTYERTDRAEGERFHTNWTGRGGTTASTTYDV